jgi:serine/threonine protein kinase
MPKQRVPIRVDLLPQERCLDSTMSDRPDWVATALLTDAERPGLPSPAAVHDGNALREGAHVGEFEIIRVLGVGGFGIVYLALDRVLLRYVAIKEYLPTSLAGRGSDDQVTVRSASHLDTFILGLESFFNEARMLASFDHPSLVKVFRFWKANGTAYMAMQYYAGRTLKDVRTAMSMPAEEPWLRELLDPILGALEVLHSQGIYHRDISPDNIILLPDGRPVLLDFGSARRVIGDRTQTLTAILKPNFAPIEQYADDAAMKQGAWTDLYALGATLEYVLTNKTPTPAVMRAVRDDTASLATTGFTGVSAEFLTVVDWMMALSPDDRPQSVGTLQQALAGDLIPPARPRQRVLSEPAAAERPVADVPAPVTKGDSYEATRLDPRYVTPDVATEGVSAPAGRGKSGSRAWIAAVLVVLAGTGAFMTLRPSNTSGAPSAPVADRVAKHEASASAVPAPTVLAALPAAKAMPEPLPASASTAAEPASATPPKPPTATTEAPTRAAKLRVLAAARADRLAVATPPANRASRVDAVAEPAPAVVASQPAAVERRPSEVCAANNFLTRAACIRRECQTPKWRAEPQCVEARAAEEAMQQRRGGQF